MWCVCVCVCVVCVCGVCVYKGLLENKLRDSKHLEDIKIKNKSINLEKLHFVCLYCVINVIPSLLRFLEIRRKGT